MDFLFQRLDLFDLVRQFSFQVIDFGLKHLSVRVESRLHGKSLFMSISGRHSGTLELLFLNLYLFDGLSLNHDSFLFLLLSCHELVLSDSEEFGCLSEVLSESLVLESEVIQFPLHVLVLGLSHVSILITLQNIALSLQLIILFVQKVDLVLKFLDSLFVLFVLVVEVDLFQILNWLVEVMESQNFIVSHLDFLLEISCELFLLCDLLLEGSEHLVVLLTSLISFTNLLRPLVLVSQDSLLDLESGGNCGWTVVHLNASVSLLNCMCHLDALFVALKHVVSIIFIKGTQSINDLVLARKINLFERFLHLGLQLDVFHIDFLNSHILRVNQELEILAFLLKLAQSLLPLELTSIFLLFDLDDLVMEFVVLLGQLFILLLKRDQGLSIQFFIMLQLINLVFKFLVTLCSLQKVVQQSLSQRSRFHV